MLAHHSTIWKLYNTTTALSPIQSIKMNSNGVYFQKLKVIKD